MKTTVIIMGIMLVLCLSLGYVVYENLDSRLDTERRLRENYETETIIILCKYLEVLDSIVQRQDSTEEIVLHSKELNLTLDALRDYNSRARLERPRKRQHSIGGSR